MYRILKKKQFSPHTKEIDSFDVLRSVHYVEHSLPNDYNDNSNRQNMPHYWSVFERESTPSAAPGGPPDQDKLKFFLRKPRPERFQDTSGNYEFFAKLSSNKPLVPLSLDKLYISNDNGHSFTQKFNLMSLLQNEDDLTNTFSGIQKEIPPFPQINITFSTSLFSDYRNVSLQGIVVNQSCLLKRVHTILPLENVVTILQNSHAVSPHDQIFLNNLIRYSQAKDPNTNVSLTQLANTLCSHRIIVPMQ